MEDRLPRTGGGWWPMALERLWRSQYLQENKNLAPGTEFNNVPLNLARFLFGWMHICNPQIPATIPTSWWKRNGSSRGSLIPASTIKIWHRAWRSSTTTSSDAVLLETGEMQSICSTVRHWWEISAFPSRRKMLSCKDNSKGLPRPPGLLRVKLSTGSTFPLKCLSFCWRGILQINLQALQINFVLGFISLSSQTDPTSFTFFFRHILSFSAIFETIQAPLSPLFPVLETTYGASVVFVFPSRVFRNKQLWKTLP